MYFGKNRFNIKKMDYTFIEIGTSDFETLLQDAKSTDVGLSVDPIQMY